MTAQFGNRAANNAPVVALHSSASGKSQWNALAAQLNDRYKLIAFDLPGYGTKWERSAEHAGMDAVTIHVIKEIEAIGRPVHLIGHSFGGAAAIRIALKRPDLIKSLILYEPASFHVLNSEGPAGRQLLSKIQKVEKTLNAALSVGRNDLGMKEFIEFWNGDNAWDKMPERLRDRLASLATLVSSDFNCAYAEDWMLDDLERLTMPTLMLMGMESPAVAQRTSVLIANHIPTAELAMLPELGHMAPVNAPEWVNPRIHQYIARVEKSAAPVSWPNRIAA